MVAPTRRDGVAPYGKIWSSHVVAEEEAGVGLLYIDRQLLHEVSSPQAFEVLREKGIGARRPDAQLGVADHPVPTRHRDWAIADPLARAQVARREANCAADGIRANTLIVARTDARQSEGLDGALARARAYADAGADILFVEALTSETEMRRRAIPSIARWWPTWPMADSPHRSPSVSATFRIGSTGA